MTLSQYHIHGYHLGTVFVALAVSFVLYFSRNFLKECLSEEGKDGKMAGSHKRIIAFILAVCVSFCEIFHTLKQGQLDIRHLVCFLVAALLYSGIATMSQILSIIKGKIGPSSSAQPIAAAEGQDK